MVFLGHITAALWRRQCQVPLSKNGLSYCNPEWGQGSSFKGYPLIRLLSKLLVGGAAGTFCIRNLHGKEVEDGSFEFTANISNFPQEVMLKDWQEAWFWLSNNHSLWLSYGKITSTCQANDLSRVFSLREALPSEAQSISSFAEPLQKDMGMVGDANDKTGYLTRHTISDAVAKAAPAVVNITATVGGRGMLLGQSSGSGVIIGTDGTILTNAHVVANVGGGYYRDKLLVTMQDGRSFDGEVVNFDSTADLAVVKIQSKIPLPTATLGSSRKLRPGEWVVALGSPLHLQNSVTVGVVSCVERKSSEIGLRGVRADYIQTDAAINQGNSGGPLLNLDGEVVGINTMKAFLADGVSFAIPIDTAVKVVEQLKKHGRVVRPWLGMKMLELTPAIVSQLKERDPTFPDISEGILVPQVIPGSPAERAGIRSGDVIVHFDSRPVSSVVQIVEILGDKIGVSFKVGVKRAHGQEETLIVISEEASPSL
eukprot:c19622_g1_i1 orf=90-1535(+)